MDDTTASPKDALDLPEPPAAASLPGELDQPEDAGLPVQEDLVQVPARRVRYRDEQRTRYVPVTVLGRTAMVPETYTVQVPIPPRDWARVHQVTVDYVVAAWSGALGFAFVWCTAGAFGAFEPEGPQAWVPLACALIAGLHTGWAGYRIRTRPRRK